jgi:apolipoprotein N-acyltransferase
MKPYQANLYAAIALVILGLWSYSASGRDAHTLIVPGFGILLSLFHKPFKNGNKAVAHIVVVLTFVMFLVMFMPLRNSIKGDQPMAIFRVVLMMLVLISALIIYVRSFIQARKDRLAKMN